MLDFTSFKKYQAAFYICLLALGLTSTVFSKPSAAPKTLVKNADIVITMDAKLGEGSLGIIKNSDVLFDHQIISVGKNLKSSNANEINGREKILLPGFVDVHNHLWQSLIRGCGADKELMGWLKECVFPMGKNNIDESEAYSGVRLSTLDLISTGVTTVLDNSHSFTPEFTKGNLKALEKSGLRFIFAYCYKRSNQIESDIEFIKTRFTDPNPLASLQVCAHPAPSTAEGLQVMSGISQKYNLPLNIHLLESKLQRSENPFQLLNKTGAFRSKIFANHVIHISSFEIAQLKKYDVSISHNPLSNMRLASGVMPIEKLYNAGIKIGLGLDGGTNDTSDMFSNMRAAVGMQRAVSLNPVSFPGVKDILRMATLGGAEALNMDNEIGSLTPGKFADLIILDMNGVNNGSSWNPINSIVFNAQPRNVKYVFVNGKTLMQNGKLVLEDNVSPDEIVSQANQAVKRIKSKLRTH